MFKVIITITSIISAIISYCALVIASDTDDLLNKDK